jgi:hypothetical protein
MQAEPIPMIGKKDSRSLRQVFWKASIDLLAQAI